MVCGIKVRVERSLKQGWVVVVEMDEKTYLRHFRYKRDAVREAEKGFWDCGLASAGCPRGYIEGGLTPLPTAPRYPHLAIRHDGGTWNVVYVENSMGNEKLLDCSLSQKAAMGNLRALIEAAENTVQ